MIEQIQTHQPSFIKRFLYRSRRPSREALVLKTKISIFLLLFLIALVLVIALPFLINSVSGTYALIAFALFHIHFYVCVVRVPWNLLNSILSFQHARRSKFLGIWMMNLMLSLIHLASLAVIIAVMYKYRIYDYRIYYSR